MTDEKIKPIIGRMSEMWLAAHRLPAGLNLYPESSIAQAEEEGRLKGLREAAEIVLNGRFLHDKAPTKLFANEAAAAITRAAEGK